MNPHSQSQVQVLAFDVFGTVVDWYGSVSAEVDDLDLGVNGGEFALAWREGYAPAMKRVSSGILPWTLIDDLHRMILETLLVNYGIDSLANEEIAKLNRVWHRLNPWPDSVEGLTRLKSRYTICTLSNGNLELLANMAEHGDLPWDRILCAETFKKYKPDPDTYLGVAKTFGVAANEVAMVAAHQSDLDAARECGLLTAYIERKYEFGPGQPKDIIRHPDNTWHGKSIVDLAEQLNC